MADARLPFVNSGTEPVAFRDDLGKHVVEPGDTFAVAGDQHLPHVLSLPGVARASAEPKAPRKVAAQE